MIKKHRLDLTLLKFFVYFMGIILAAAMLFITYTIYTKSYQDIKGLDRANHNIQCNSGQLFIDKKIISSSFEKGKIALLLEEKNNQQKLMILDSCTWEIISEAHFNIKNNNTNALSQYNKEPDEENLQILS